MKNFLLFVLFFCLVFSFANITNADTSNIAKITFITNPQTIAPNELSKYITLQIQDASGNQVTALETIRFDVFQSTSPTGVFVSCTTPTNPPTDYLSKNGSNKNICYKDSTEGVYTITAKTNNTSVPLVATQLITISSGTTPPPGGGTSTTTSTSTSDTSTSTDTTNTTGSNNSGSSYYVYSSPVSLSTYEPLNLSVEAGRDRLVFLHSPVEFKSYTSDKTSGRDIYGARYFWTFGDGSSGKGSIVNHSYIFPGEYNVVLNSTLGNDDAVDIAKVKVVDPQVAMTYANSYIELANLGSSDLNIGGWKVRGNDKDYTIPKDTIILVKGSIKIPATTVGAVFGSEKLALIYPDNQLALETVKVSGLERQKQISEMSQNLAMLQEKLNSVSVGENSSNELVDSNQASQTTEDSVKKVENEASQDANVASVVEAPASKSVLSKIVEFFGTMFR